MIPLRPAEMAEQPQPPAQPRFDGGDLWWLAGPGGELIRRRADGSTGAPLPDGTEVRSLVHEFGGGDYAVRHGTVVYSDHAAQRLYRLTPEDGEPYPLTPPTRYADLEFTPDGAAVYCVRETHQRNGPVINELVRVRVDERAPVLVVASGADFYAFPRLSPDGGRLAWTTWNHPHLPWDATELWVADVAADGSVTAPRRVAGGPGESVFQPGWDQRGRLHFVTDRSGWWNLAREVPGGTEPVVQMAAEFAVPQWTLGMSTYAFLDDGRIACLVNSEGRQRLGVIEDGRLSLPSLPWQSFAGPWLASDGRRVACVAASWSEPASLQVVDMSDSDSRRVESRSVAHHVATEPILIRVPVDGTRTVPTVYHPGAGARPPLILVSHGGPTAQIFPELAPQTLFWTSRGFAVAYVNYRGSSGFGRGYRRALYGHWGDADVADCVAVARYLAEHELADPERLAIRGLSSGGLTVLNAMATTTLFACGVGVFPVSDPATLAARTHKFESHYVQNLMGWPDGVLPDPSSLGERFRGIDRPMLLLHGVEDTVVPIAQTDALVEELRARAVPVTYLRFDHEGHGFRHAETIRRGYEAELDFYEQAFGIAVAAGDPA